MKRKLLALALALVICVSLCGNVFAGTSVKTGKTSGASGPGTGSLNVTARLTVDQNTARATTDVLAMSGVTVSTTVIYYYLNSSAQTEATSAHGTTSATTGNTRSSGVRATSQHSVNGGSTWGSWSCSLSANAGV